MSIKNKNYQIGIIAEDISDVNSINILIQKITGNKRIGIKKFVGDGCGKIKRKCNMWAKQFHMSGCHGLILIHDRDRNNTLKLKNDLFASISPCPIKKYLICIPEEELEAWLVSDEVAIKKGLNLRNLPPVVNFPETIVSPKEYIEKMIHKISKGEKRYLNTIHNEKIASFISIDIVKRKCPSFIPLYDFLNQNFK